MATGSFSDWRQIERFGGVTATVIPRPADVYERGYHAYRGLYPALQDVLRIAREPVSSLKEAIS
jgi:hypothetical protein